MRNLRLLKTLLAAFALGVCASCGSKTATQPNAQDSWRLERELIGHTGGVRSAEFSVDGRLIASGASETIIWDAKTGAEKLRINGPVNFVVLSPDATCLAIAAGSKVRVHAVIDGRELYELPLFKAQVCAPAFSPDGARLATASGDGQIDIWDSLDGKHVTSFQTPKVAFTGKPPEGPRMVAFSKEGGRLGVAFLKNVGQSMPEFLGDPWNVVAWEIASGDDVTDLLSSQAREGLKPDRLDGAHWVSGPEGQSLPWDSIDRFERVGFKEYLCIMAFTSPDGKTGLTTHEDGRIRLWKHE